jgi:hypothetical protein
VPIPAEFVPLDRGRLDRLAEHLRKATIVEARYTERDPTWAGRPGSLAERDRTWTRPRVNRGTTKRAVETTYAAARLGLVAVTDQCLSLARLVTEAGPGPLGSLGVEALSRSAIEMAARSWWLLEPGIDPPDRVARFLADQLFSAYEAERMAREMQWAHGVTGISPESVDIMRTCDELHLNFDSNQQAPTVDGQTRPRSTALVPRLLRETIYAPSHAMVYRLTSATAHGTHYALMRGYKDTGERLDGEPVLVRHVDHRQIEPVAGVVLESFIAALRRAIKLGSWGWITVDSYEMAVRQFLWTMPY